MANKCIDTKSQFFKNKAKEFNISESKLESIALEYLNTPELLVKGKEDFPTDLFIEYYLFKPNILKGNKSKNIDKLKMWRDHFSKPLYYPKLTELVFDYINKLKTYFEPENVLVDIITINDENLVVVNVRRPVCYIENPGLEYEYIGQNRGAFEYDLQQYKQSVGQAYLYKNRKVNPSLYNSKEDFPGRHYTVHTPKNNDDGVSKAVVFEEPNIDDPGYSLYTIRTQEPSYAFNRGLKLDSRIDSSRDLILELPILKEDDGQLLLFQHKLSVDNIKQLESENASHPIIKFISNIRNKDSKLKKLSVSEIYSFLTQTQDKDLAKLYNEYYLEEIDKGLEEHLMNYLKQYGITIEEDSEVVKTYGVLGIYNVLRKTIHLAKTRDRNSITFAEEFAHAFIRLNGTRLGSRSEYRDYTTLFNHIEKTSIYAKVYKEYKDTYKDKQGNINIDKIKEEAIGQALAVAIKKKWDLRKISPKKEELTFWQKLRNWFNKILDRFFFYNEIKFQKVLDDIATDVINNNHSRLNKLQNTENFALVKYETTLQNASEETINLIKYFSNLGNILAGSLAYRKQGTLYRKSIDDLHDIDMLVPKSTHNIEFSSIGKKYLINNGYSNIVLEEFENTEYFKKIANDLDGHFKLFAVYSDLDVLTFNAIYSKNTELYNKFLNLEGSPTERLNQLSEEELKQIYLLDFFLYENDSTSSIKDVENNLNLASWETAFKEKLKMGRPKDVYDYQKWQLYSEFKEHYIPDSEYLMFQLGKKIVYNKEQKHAIKEISTYMLNKLTGVEDSRQYMTLLGMAGTGKTTIINPILEEILNYCKANNLPIPSVGIAALSHQAKEALFSKIDKTLVKELRIKAYSIAQLLGYKELYDEVSQTMVLQPSKNNNPFDKAPIKEKRIIIIDECSMIGELEESYIDKEKEPNTIILYTGDSGQIAPIRSNSFYTLGPGRGINESSVSPLFKTSSVDLFSNSSSNVVNLKERVRQGENSPILKLADLFWDIKNPTLPDANSIMSFTSEISDLGDVINGGNISTEDSISDTIVEAFAKAKKLKDSNYVRIVTAKVATKEKYNKLIHKALFNNDELFCEGECIIFDDNYYEGTELKVANSETAYIQQIRNASREAQLPIDLDFVRDNFSDLFDIIQTLNIRTHTDYLGNTFLNLPLLEYEINTSKKSINVYSLNEEYNKIYKLYKLYIGTLYRVLKTKTSTREANAFYSLYKKGSNLIASFSQGYAITSHKSQGSTYNISIVDAADFYNTKGFSDTNKSRMMYTAITRASNIVILNTRNSQNNLNSYNINERNAHIIDSKIKQTPVFKPLDVQDAEIIEESTNYTNELSYKIGDHNVNIKYRKTGKYSTNPVEIDPKTSEIIINSNGNEDPISWAISYYFGETNDSASTLYKEVANRLISEGYTKEYLHKVLNKSNISKFLLLFGYNKLNKNGSFNNSILLSKDNINIIADSIELSIDILAEELGISKPGKEEILKTIQQLEIIRKINEKNVSFNEESHTYIVNGVVLDTSVSTVVRRFEEINPNQYLEVSAALGTEVDIICRDYFLNSKHSSSTLLNTEQLKKLYISLDTLKAQILEKHGKDCKIYTDEDYLRVFGKVTIDSKEYSVGGTMDLIVVDMLGNIHIYDFKTNRTIKDDLELNNDKVLKYNRQLALYKLLLSIQNPTLKDKIKSLNLIQFNLYYPTPKDAGGQVNYTLNNNQIITEYNKLQGIIQDLQISAFEKFKSPTFTRLVPLLDKEIYEVSKLDTLIDINEAITGITVVSDSYKIQQEDIRISDVAVSDEYTDTLTNTPKMSEITISSSGKMVSLSSLLQKPVEKSKQVEELKTNTSENSIPVKVIYKRNANEPAREYTVIGDKIYNSENVEVFTNESDGNRRKIFANLEVIQGKAVVVEYKNAKYVVNKDNKIISVTTGKEMLWGEENGDRNNIIHLAELAFLKKSQSNEKLNTETKQLSINEIGKGFVMLSGGAKGSDNIWGKIAKSLGIKVNHWYHSKPTDYGNIELSKEDFEEGIVKVKRAAIDIKRAWKDDYVNLLARNWNQVKYADTILAIGHIVVQGEKNKAGFTVKATQVDGGTGYAVQMAITENKPVYVFDLERKTWYHFSKKDGGWVALQKNEVPIITSNFAGIGTREINEEGIRAILNVFYKSFKDKVNESNDAFINHLKAINLVSDSTTAARLDTELQVKEVVKKIKEGITLDYLKEVTPVFNEEEISQIKEAMKKTKNNTLKVVSASRATDPVFYSKQIIEFLKENSKKSFTDPTRVNALELWTKHDGLPLQEVLQACKQYKVAPIVSFSITSLGNTSFELGVLKYQDLLNLIKGLIDKEMLLPQTTTIRIDPYLPGVTQISDFENIIKQAHSFGIKKFVTSTMLSYSSLANRKNVMIDTDKAYNLHFGVETGYPWETYYGKTKDGRINFMPLQEVRDKFSEELLKIKESLNDEEVRIEACSTGLNGISYAACLDPTIIEAITGVDGISGNFVKSSQREKCCCYATDGDLFNYSKQCYSACAYCYATHSNDSALNYYDENGNLKYDKYTTLEEDFYDKIKEVDFVSDLDRLAYEASRLIQLNKSFEIVKDKSLLDESVSTIFNEELYDLQAILIGNLSNIFTGGYSLTVNTDNIGTEEDLEKLSAYITSNLEISNILAWKNATITKQFLVLYEKLLTKGMYPTKLVKEIPVSKESTHLIEQAKSLGIKYNYEKGVLLLPSLCFGYTQGELEHLHKKEVLFNGSNINPSKLRTLAKGAIFKMSDIITQLTTDPNAKLLYFGEDYKDVDFTKFSRIDLIKKVGLNRLLYIIKEDRFNIKKRPDLLSKSMKLIKELNTIYQNFDVFIPLAYDTLIGLEEVAFNESTDIKTDINDRIFTEEEELEIQEIYGSSLESWLVGFRQISAYSNLSKMIKRTVEKMYAYDSNGQLIFNDYGDPVTLKPQEVVASILNWTQGAVDIEDMISKLEVKKNAYPWLELIISLLRPQENHSNEQFRSQFFTNFKKYFLKYSISFKKGDSIEIKTINELGVSDSVINEIKNRIDLHSKGKFNLVDILGNIKLDKIQELKDILNILRNSKINVDNKINSIKKLAEILHIALPEDVILIQYLKSKVTEESDLISEVLGVKLSYLLGLFKNAKNLTDTVKGKLLKDLLINQGDYKAIIKFLTEPLADSKETVSYEGGKLHYSYVTPSYLNILIGKLQGKLYKYTYEQFLFKEYLSLPWFKQGDVIYNKWLDRLYSDSSYRNLIDHKVSLHFLDVPYNEKTPDMYIASMINEFNYDDHRKSAWFRIPTMSNKPSEEYIKFERITSDDYKSYKEKISSYLYNVFLQESKRIKAVKQRAVNKAPKINAFDNNGSKFCFLDYLNKYVDDNYITEEGISLGEILLKYLSLNQEVSSEELLIISKEIPKIISKELDNIFKETLEYYKSVGYLKVDEKTGEVTTAYPVKTKSDETILDVLELFFWNDHFAAIQMMQLFVTDIAFYKNVEDIQKRLAQLHAPYSRVNKLARDSKGNLYSEDGTYRVITIKDKIVKSELSDNLKIVYDNLKAKYKHNSRMVEMLDELLEFVLDSLKKVNETDALSYSSPTSLRKKLGLLGEWTDEMEAVYQKILKGNYTIENLNILWQPIKPFVYSLIVKDGHNDYLPKIKMGVQIKNSEYTLLMIDAILRSGNLPNRLSAIYDFMEESQGLTKQGNTWVGTPNGKGIDTVTFDSTIKTGLTGILDINTPTTPELIIETLKDATYNQDGSYNTDNVYEFDFESWGKQQEVPSHFKHKSIVGSQNRILHLEDVELYREENGQLVDNTITIEIEGKKETLTVKDAKDKYYNSITSNIEESVEEVCERLGLNYSNKKLRNIALSKILQDTILKDSRFGHDLLWACSTNIHGEFNIPLSDPIHSNRIQQLLNSIIKNNLNKQLISGGPVVQVTGWGTSRSLNIRFKNKEGKVLLTKLEFNNYKTEGRKALEDSHADYCLEALDDTYELYLKTNQHSVAYFECYAPIYDDNLYKDFVDENGNIDIQKIEKSNPDILRMVGYRIPTEAKYSMVPLKIVGFLPRNSEGIMLPKEITWLSGSDFDIDKLYIMRYDLNRVSKSVKMAKDYLGKKATEEGVNKILNYIYIIKTNGERDTDTFKRFKEWYESNKDKYQEIYWERNNTKQGRNDNTMIDIQYGILTSDLVLDLFLTPGNFENLKKLGYFIQVYELLVGTTDNVIGLYNQLMLKSVDDLQKMGYKNKNLMFNHVQSMFHSQNTVAGKLIGIFAQANVSHAFMSLLDDFPALNIPLELSFKLDGFSALGSISIDSIRNRDDERISSLLASLLAASVDAVKDPILNLLNINEVTAIIAISMIRMGFNLETVMLTLNQPIIKLTVLEYRIKNATEFVDFTMFLSDKIKSLKSNIKFDNLVNINNGDGITKELLIEGLSNPSELNNKLFLQLLLNLNEISKSFKNITHITRYNSVTSAVGPSAADTYVNIVKDNAFITDALIDETTKNQLLNHPILSAFRENSYSLEGELLGKNILQATPLFRSISDKLEEDLGYMNKKIANKFTEFFMSYYVNISTSKRNPVIDLSYENRKYYLTEFPLDFLNLKEKHKDNIFINAIEYKTSDTEAFPYLAINTRSLQSEEIEDLKNAWGELYDVDKKLALLLVEYVFFRGSFGFNPKTFSLLIPNKVKTSLPNYVSNIQMTSILEGVDINRLLLQFKLNNQLVNGTIKESELEYVTETEEGVYLIKDSVNTYKHGQVFTLDRGKSSKTLVYVIGTSAMWTKLQEVLFLGYNGQGFEIDPNNDIVETVFTADNVQEIESKILALLDLDTSYKHKELETSNNNGEDSMLEQLALKTNLSPKDILEKKQEQNMCD